MYQENDTVIANRDLSPSIMKGTKGVIHAIYDDDYILVEFVDANGDTIGDGMERVCVNDIEAYSSKFL